MMYLGTYFSLFENGEHNMKEVSLMRKSQILCKANFGKDQYEFCEIEQRMNILRRLLYQHLSTQYQDTLDIVEAIQVAERIEELSRFGRECKPSDVQPVYERMRKLIRDLDRRIAQIDDPDIGNVV